MTWTNLREEIDELFADAEHVDWRCMHADRRVNTHYLRVIEAASASPIVRVRDLALALGVSSVAIGRALSASGEWRLCQHKKLRQQSWVNERAVLRLFDGRDRVRLVDVPMPSPLLRKERVGHILRKHGWRLLRTPSYVWVRPCST